MSLPSKDPVRSRIRQAAVYGLKNRITTAGGYWNNVKRAYDPVRTYEQFDVYPCINVSTENEICDNASDFTIEQQQLRLHNSFILQMVAFLNDNNDPALAEDKILADIQMYFGKNFRIPDSAGTATAFNCYYEGAEPIGTNRTKPNTGIIVKYRVWYRQFSTDPAIAG